MDGCIIQVVNFRIAILPLLFSVTLFPPGGDKPFNPPRATHAKTYPAVEVHDDEQVSVAIDPFDLPDKAAVFRTNYKEHNFLPVRVIISNDSDKTLILRDLTAQYITSRRDKLEPATNDDLYRRLARATKRPDKQSVPLPIPLPKKNKPAVATEVLREVDDAMLTPVPVTAHSTYSGFLFFDIAGIEVPEAGAHVFLSGMKIDGKELFYFDIPLEKYLNHQPGKTLPELPKSP
ncbi:MAG TPA: hypothetical protein VNW97_05800 [Candidatus Saccharimonadales bacterium]|nr:hypothetical protein [Candidatus Saccharimonadales bacterium]